MSTFLPVTAEGLADAVSMAEWLELATLIEADTRALSWKEQRIGWRVYRLADGTERRVAVGWRRDIEAAQAEQERKAAMAKCPYHACTCGYHEE